MNHTSLCHFATKPSRKETGQQGNIVKREWLSIVETEKLQPFHLTKSNLCLETILTIACVSDELMMLTAGSS